MAKKYKFNETANTLNRHDDNVYKVTGAGGSTRLIKYTDEGYVELNMNDGSELRSIPSGEAIELIGYDTKPISFEEKTSYIKKFDDSANTYLDPKQTGLEEITTDTATNKRLNAATARGKQWDWEQGQALPDEIRMQQQDAGRSGESISMAEFNRAKDWEAGRRPITDNAPTARLPSDPNEIENFQNTNYSLAPSGNYTGGTSEHLDKGGAPGTVDAGYFQKGSAGNYQQFTGGQTDFPSLQSAMAPGLDQKNLVVGKGGGTWDVDSDYYMKDGTLMKDGGWFSGDTAATQADINAGIKNQASPGMTSADGWNAAGSVMKGVGGLASAYTGIKNYQLARDAHNTQKNQWQANYDQQLKAFEQNKKLANQEIQERNRILKSRNPNRTDLYKEL